MSATEGRKDDGGKLLWRLLPIPPVREIVRVLTFGAVKYEPNNWKHVEPRHRYTDAMLRHITAWMDGERDDHESELHHLAHAGCCLLFILYFELKGESCLD